MLRRSASAAKTYAMCARPCIMCGQTDSYIYIFKRPRSSRTRAVDDAVRLSGSTSFAGAGGGGGGGGIAGGAWGAGGAVPDGAGASVAKTGPIAETDISHNF